MVGEHDLEMSRLQQCLDLEQYLKLHQSHERLQMRKQYNDYYCIKPTLPVR